MFQALEEDNELLQAELQRLALENKRLNYRMNRMQDQIEKGNVDITQVCSSNVTAASDSDPWILRPPI